MRGKMTFWFEFASTYSYLTVMRIDAAAEAAGVEVTWKPLMLGPIFAAQGLTDSPFNIYQTKGAFMWRDMERRAAAYGLPYRKPVNFPQHTVLAARVAFLALQQPQGKDLCKALYRAEFENGQNLKDPGVIAAALSEVGLPESYIEEAQTQANKDALKAQVAEAMSLGVFGAPSFTIGSELFWGDDQLEQALSWATSA